MKKKAISVLLVAAMTATMFAGCGSSSSDSASTSDTKSDTSSDAAASTEGSDKASDAEASGNPVTLKTVSMFGGTDANGPAYQEINETFQEENSNVKLEDNSAKSDDAWKASITADFAVGNEPDVIQYFTDATANTILSTDKFMTVEEIQAEYPDYGKDITEDSFAASTNPDGVSRAVPTTGFWEGLFCNKDLFDQYELELPTDWETFTTAIETFKENGIIPIACSLNNVPHYWIEFLTLYSAGEESYTSIPEKAPAEWVAGFDTLKTLRDMGAFPEDTDTVDDSYTKTLFIEKKAAMQLDGSWLAGNITDTDNTVVINFPGVENQKAKAGAMVGGISSGFYITKKAWEDPDKRDAAVKFVMAHTSKEGIQKYWEATGAISKAAAKVDAIDGMTPLALSALDYAAASTSVSAPTDSRLGAEPYAILTSNAVKISTGAAKSEEVIQEALDMYKEIQSQTSEAEAATE